MLDYAEYKDVLNILERSNHEDSYRDLMAKEMKVLDTINAVSKSYKDRILKNEEFIQRGFHENVARFWVDMGLLVKELVNVDWTEWKKVRQILTKGERVIYFGLLFIALGVILFFLEISK